MANTPTLGRLYLLGAFRLVGRGGERIEVSSKKGVALIALLAMASEGERTRGWLQGRLWGTRNEAQAKGSLRRELSNLRSRLNTAGAPLLICEHDRVRLDLNQLWVDARALDAEAPGQGGLIPGDFLEGLDLAGEDGFEDWLREQRGALRERGFRSRRTDAAGQGAAVTASGASTARRASDPMLAILPFDKLTDDREMDYFSDGISEEILQAMARTFDLKVIGRSSSFQFRGKDKSIARVASELSASHVLDGSVQRRGERVRITASLIECGGQTTVWSARYDRELSDVFALQDEIAAMVASALHLVFAPAGGARNIDPAAHDLYLRARSLVLLPPHAEECIRLLKVVVGRAPDFAAAWATLSMAIATSARQLAGPEGLAPLRDEAIAAAERASALDPGSGLPFVARALMEPFSHIAQREALLNAALAVAPTDSVVLKHAADFACTVGRTREAFELISRAQEIDPLNHAIAEVAAEKMADLGMLRESYAAYAAARARWPDFEWAVAAPLLIAANLRDWVTAEPLIGIASAIDGRDSRFVLATVELLKAPLPVLREWMMATVERQLARSGSVDLRVPMFLYSAGLKEEAFEAVARSSFDYLRKASPERIFVDGIIFGVTNVPMRKDPRFIDLCGRLGLCGYWIASGRWPDCVAEAAPFYDFKALSHDFVQREGAA